MNGHADGHGQDDPVVAAGGGHTFLGGGDGVAEPAQAPDALAALVGQGVVHQQGDGAEELEAGEDEDADAVGQAPRRPGGALEEVVVGVQAVALGVIGEGSGCAFSATRRSVCLPRHMTQARSSWEQVTAEGCVKVGARASTKGERDGIMFHMGEPLIP